MIEETNQQVDEKNRWRLETPGHRRLAAHRTSRRSQSTPDDFRRLPRQRAEQALVGTDRREVSQPPAAYRSRRKGQQVDGRRGLSAIARPQGLEDRRAKGRRGSPARQRRPRPARSDPRPCARRHRRRDRISQQGSGDVRDAGRRIRRRAMPRVERLGVGDLRPVQRFHVADGGDHDCRSRPGDGRNQAGGEDRLSRR